MKNSEKIFLHTQLFHIQKTEFFHAFLRHLAKEKNFCIECSFKIESQAIHPCRFNVWFNGDYWANIARSMHFIQGFERIYQDVTIDHSSFDHVLGGGLSSSDIKRVVLGVDFRDRRCASRVKLWLVLANYHQYLDKIFNYMECGDKYAPFFVNPHLLLGFDFSFDGGNPIKIYPVLYRHDLDHHSLHPHFQRFFDESTIELMRLCDRFHVGIKQVHSDLVLHFHPVDWTHFIKKLNSLSCNPLMNHSVAHLFDKDIGDVFISLSQREVRDRCLENMNFYYM